MHRRPAFIGRVMGVSITSGRQARCKNRSYRRPCW